MSEFLAEATVRIAPDTTLFRAQLLAQLTAATRGVTATIPVTAIVGPALTGQTRAVRAAVEQLEVVTAQQAAVATTATKAAAASRELTRAQTLAATAGTKLAVAESEVRNVTTALIAAQITATRSAAAVAAAERALAAARTAGNAALIAAAGNSLRLAQAQQLEATTALAAARAQSAHASSLSFLQRGAGATGLSLLGVRGATLAANSAFLVGAAAVVTFAKSIQLAAGLEQELNVFRVTAQATADEMERVRDQAVALGRDISLPGVSAGDAAQAFTELAKAGLGVEDALAGARGVLQLAAAAQISNAEATELAASALNAFGLAGDEAVHVADLLANAANEAQGSISDMGLALRQSAAVARQVGISIEDTVTLLTLLARNGLAGSDAGTALRTSLIRLINPTKEASSIIRQLGINLRDAQGNIRPEVFADFAKETANLTRKEQDAAAAIVFGQDAIRAQAILGREGISAFDALSIAIQRQGAAAELAGARAQGFSGQLSALGSNLETLGTTAGRLVLPALTAIVGTLNETVTTISTAVEAVAELTGQLGSLGDSIVGTIPGADRFLSVVGDIAKISFGGPALTGIKVFGRLSDVFTASADEIQAKADETEEAIEDLFRVFREDPGPTALNQLVLSLDEMADKLAQGDAQAQRLAQGIRQIIHEIQNFSTSAPFREGFTLPPIDVSSFLSDLDGVGQKGGDIVVDALRGAIADQGRGIGLGLMKDLEGGIKEGALKIRFDTIPLSVERITRRFEEQLLDAQIADERRRQLDILRREEALIEEQLAAGVKRREKRVELKKALDKIQDEIAALEEGIASDARDATDKIERARDERDQAIIDSIRSREARLQNAVLIAEANESLRNDIRANEALRAFYQLSIEEVRKTVREAKLREQLIAQLTRELIRAEQEADRLEEEVQERRRERRRRQRERIRENLKLNIQIAEATGNQAAEIRAREAEISRIQFEIRQTRRGSLQRKRLILELRQAQAELRELRDERKKTTQSFRELTFEFLQTQQGFAANLLSNLLPAGAAAGTVGGAAAPVIPVVPRPERAVAAAAAVAEGRDRGVTQGQFSVLIDLARQMVNLLSEGNRGRAHPEARNQSVVGRAALDYFD